MLTRRPLSTRSLAMAALPVVLLLGFLPVTPAAEDGLVGYWGFDEVEGIVTPDGSGNGNDATIAVATVVKGVSGTALQFDGRSATARCVGTGFVANAPALTVEAWVKPEVAHFGGYPAVVRREGVYALRFAGNALGFIIWFDGAPVTMASAKRDWVADQWYHVAGTYDGTNMRLYIDGEEDGASPLVRPGLTNPGVENCGIGSVNGQYALPGTIDEVRVYSRTLSPDELRASHQRGRDSLLAQANVTVEPRQVGAKPVAFRKPEREISMVQDGFIWIDAEDFTEYGGWLLDTQFVHLMGSAYLIAAGIGTPVEDATVTVSIPRAATYRLWVRDKNWYKDFSPGKFAVLVNGRQTDAVFGDSDTEDWVWQSAGEYTLPAGEATLALRDLTGYYGRCDALLLTTDMNYTPPAELDAVRRERARLTGISLEPQVVGDFDVIVVGAGSAGSPAALAAARGGAKTALIQNRPVLGGNASKELGVPINGAASSHPNARESGIIEEVGRIKARYGHMKMSEPFMEASRDEKNLSVFLNQHVFEVEMADDTHISAVRAIDTLRNTVTEYRGKMFVDCTGDGWVGYYAGAEYRLGREARDEFNESLAPEKADEITMSGCLMGGRSLSYRAISTGKPVEYVAPPWAPKFPEAEEFSRDPRGFTGGQWWLEHPGDIDDIWDAERARDELLRITFGYWDYIKNTWPEREKAATYTLEEVPIVEAKRESRRLVGDYLLNQNDVQSARVFPDAVSYGGWPLDIHHPQGIYSGKGGPYDYTPQVPIYTIPYRCLYSKNIDNLLFAGRDMSVTHVALGSVRVQGTLAALGQAAGTAAAYALEKGVTPRGIYEKYMTDFQQLLMRNDQYIPGFRNEDPADLARKATVSASSLREFDEFGKDQVRKGDMHPLNMPRAVMLPRGLNEHLKSVYALLRSEREEPVELNMHLRGGDESGDFSSREDIATASATVPVGDESWVRFDLDADIAKEFMWVWLEPAEGIDWRLMDSAPLGSCRGYGGGETGDWTVMQGQYYAVYTDPGIASKAGYEAVNVLNGTTRIIGKSSNMWASDPNQPMPQWVELDFAEPVDLNAAYLTFDTDMNATVHTVPYPPECIRDYQLAYWDGGQWQVVADEIGNFQRRRVHRFDTVKTSKVRLTVLATNGSRSARVFEIRAYNE